MDAKLSEKNIAPAPGDPDSRPRKGIVPPNQDQKQSTVSYCIRCNKNRDTRDYWSKVLVTRDQWIFNHIVHLS